MAFLYDEKYIRELCDSINMHFIERFYNKEKKHTYVKVICNTHDYKGIQTIEVDQLKRWSSKGKCLCDIYNRDTEDLRRVISPDIEIVGEYIKSNIKIECECKKCKTRWMAAPNKLQQGRGCPKCKWNTIRGKNRFTFEYVSEKVKEKQPNIELIGEYINIKTKIKYRCKSCGYEGFSSPEHLLDLSASCRNCKSTVGERLVHEWLQNNGIEHIQQYTFQECKDKQPLRFDFYLPLYNTCIEYQGEQHYAPIKFQKSRYDNIDEDFKSQQRRDNIKREYCKTNNIKLIEIPYWEQRNIDNYLKTHINN